MKENFRSSLRFLGADEGGNDDDKDDHGGRTSRGVTQKEYWAWCLEKGYPQIDVWKAPQEHIDTIYHDEYWLPWCDLLSAGLDYAFFDMSVNGGPHEAIILGQRALGVHDDGRVGAITREAARNANAQKVLIAFDNEKRKFYKSLHQPKYINGWLNRCDHVLMNAKTLLPK